MPTTGAGRKDWEELGTQTHALLNPPEQVWPPTLGGVMTVVVLGFGRLGEPTLGLPDGLRRDRSTDGGRCWVLPLSAGTRKELSG